MEQTSTLDWLQAHQKSVSAGFASILDSKYIDTMNNRYPVAFIGPADIILSTQIIKMFESIEACKGNRIGYGIKERMLLSLRLTLSIHHTYCNDYIPAGSLRDMAIYSASYTMDFFQAMVVHIDDKIKIFASFGLNLKQLMLLVSNQVVQICDDLFEFRQHTSNVDPSNRT